MTVTGKEHARRVEDHYRRRWGAPLARERLVRGRIGELPPEFEVLVFAYSDREAVYGTVAMSQPEDEEPLEVHLLTARHARPLHVAVEWLTMVAHFHRTGATLGLGHTVNIGRPWVAGSGWTHALLSLPYLDGPALEWLDEPRVRFLWLIPITERERDFKVEHGLDALEERFERAGFNYLDPMRPSVV